MLLAMSRSVPLVIASLDKGDGEYSEWIPIRPDDPLAT